jgi:hypothetical protein
MERIPSPTSAGFSDVFDYQKDTLVLPPLTGQVLIESPARLVFFNGIF